MSVWSKATAHPHLPFNPPSLCVSILKLTPCPRHQLTPLRFPSPSNRTCHTPLVCSKSTVLSPPIYLQPFFFCNCLESVPSNQIIICLRGEKGVSKWRVSGEG